MSQAEGFLPCYNRCCGKKFDPNDNKEGDCFHHPGYPVFHDAYKGWSCCNKKCTDFTEFLNIKGCTKSKHSNVKPVEPEKPAVEKLKAGEVIQINVKPLNNSLGLERLPLNTPQIILKPTITPTLLEQFKRLTPNTSKKEVENKVEIGESCKNNACTATFDGLTPDNETCNYHPGVAIFHEGIKYWSCCQKKTSDFTTFLEQKGCTQGSHVWMSKNAQKKIQCRMDWHQTGSYVVVSVYAKKYHPYQSTVKLNPVHLTIVLFFVEENSQYELDIELRGIVDVAQSSVNMLPTKVEIKLKKAEPGSWTKLDFSKTVETQATEDAKSEENISTQVEAVDLNDL